MEFIVKGKLDKKYFNDVEQELSELIPVPDYIEKIFITDNLKHANVLFKDFPKSFEKQFALEFEKERTSMAFTHGDTEVIVVLVTKENEYLKRSKMACIGTLAHELVHVLHEKEGLYEFMNKCFEKNFSKYYQHLRTLNFSIEEVSQIAANLGATTSLVLKDLYMIQELISRGMGEYIIDDYYLQMSKLASSPKFYSSFNNATRDQMLNVINFELALLPTVLPFEGHPEDRARKLVHLIHNKYEKNIREVVTEFLALDRLYDEEFGWSWDFQKKFYTEVYRASSVLLSNRCKLY